MTQILTVWELWCRSYPLHTSTGFGRPVMSPLCPSAHRRGDRRGRDGSTPLVLGCHIISQPMRSPWDVPPRPGYRPDRLDLHTSRTSHFGDRRLDPYLPLKIFRPAVDVSLERHQLREEHHEEESWSEPRRITSPVGTRRRSGDFGHDARGTCQRSIEEGGPSRRPDHLVDGRNGLVPDIVRTQLVLTPITNQPGDSR